MLRMTKLAAGAFIVFGVFSFFGPLLFAVLATAFALNLPPDPWPTRSEGDKLVSAYRDNEKNRFRTSYDFPPPDGAECGYKPAELFPGDGLIEAAEKKEFTHYWGYFILDRWRIDVEWKAFNTRIAEELDDSVGQFQLGFLRRCITTTLARSICMSHVEELIHSSAKNVPRHLDGSETILRGTTNDVVCLYADGVAARIDIPLQSKGEE